MDNLQQSLVLKSLTGADRTSSRPPKPSLGGGTPATKVPWVGQVCVLSDMACPKVQSGLAVLREIFRSWFPRKKCAPRHGAQLFSGHAQPSFGMWPKNAGRVSQQTFPVSGSSGGSTKFGVGLVFIEEKKMESPLEKNVRCGVVNKRSLRAKSASLDGGRKSFKVCFLWQGLWWSLVLKSLTGRTGLAHTLPKQALGWDPRPKGPLGQTSFLTKPVQEFRVAWLCWEKDLEVGSHKKNVRQGPMHNCSLDINCQVSKVAGKLLKSLSKVVKVLVFHEVRSRTSLQRGAKIGKSSKVNCVPWCGAQLFPESKKCIP